LETSAERKQMRLGTRPTQDIEMKSQHREESIRMGHGTQKREGNKTKKKRSLGSRRPEQEKRGLRRSREKKVSARTLPV